MIKRDTMKIKYLFLSLFFLSSAIVVNAQNVRCVVLSIKAGALKTQIENENKQVKKELIKRNPDLARKPPIK